MKYQLLDEYYIRDLDDKNWVYCKTNISKKTKLPYEKILGYSGTLKGIWNLAIDELTLMPECNRDLLETLGRLEKLKVDIDFK